jgi:hypothetical protein
MDRMKLFSYCVVSVSDIGKVGFSVGVVVASSKDSAKETAKEKCYETYPIPDYYCQSWDVLEISDFIAGEAGYTRK